MKNILIRIDDKIYEQLKLKANCAHTSIAGLVRKAIAVYLAGDNLHSADAILALEGSAGSKRKDAAAKHDKYIYGRKL